MRSVAQIFAESIAVNQLILDGARLPALAGSVGNAMVEVFRSGGHVHFCGNGGSAADAQHFAAELSAHYLFDRPPLAASVLHGNPSHVTAVSNDDGYEQVFSRALAGSGRPGDMLVAISTSGNSPSVVHAARHARENGIRVVALTGEGGGALAALADILLDVPSRETGRIQEAHVVFLHAISEHVEHEMFGR